MPGGPTSTSQPISAPKRHLRENLPKAFVVSLFLSAHFPYYSLFSLLMAMRRVEGVELSFKRPYLFRFLFEGEIKYIF